MFLDILLYFYMNRIWIIDLEDFKFTVSYIKRFKAYVNLMLKSAASQQILCHNDIRHETNYVM